MSNIRADIYNKSINLFPPKIFLAVPQFDVTPSDRYEKLLQKFYKNWFPFAGSHSTVVSRSFDLPTWEEISQKSTSTSYFQFRFDLTVWLFSQIENKCHFTNKKFDTSFDVWIGTYEFYNWETERENRQAEKKEGKTENLENRSICERKSI